MIAYVLPQWVGWVTIVIIGCIVVGAIWAVFGSTRRPGCHYGWNR